MDADRFDVMARMLSTPLPRRAPLVAIVAAALGISARAKSDVLGKKKKKKCKGNTKKCGKRCIPKTECCEACGSKTCCNGACVDLATDPTNCGVCSRRCAKNECLNGACPCGTNNSCPTGCGCALTSDPGKVACVGPNLTATSCDLNSECDLGVVCRQTAGGNFCGEACSG